MARARLPLFDFRGGVNRSFTEDALDNTELAVCQNGRVGDRFGGIVKRVGSQRIHTDTLESGAAIFGVHQWDHATEKLAAVCNGDFFHKTLAETTWTNVAGTLSTTVRAIFQQHVIAGSPTLYFANGEYCKWTGAALTEAVAGAPSALFIAFYKGRMFATDGTKTLYWSKIADPDTWAAPDGGSDPVGVSDAEGLVGLCPVGASLLLFKEDSIARFTGTTQDTIKVDEETDGVSADIGCIAPGTILRVEDFCFFLSDRGPHIATEAGVQDIGVKIQTDMLALDGTYRSKSWAEHLKSRNEVWLFVPENGETTNNVFWIWNYRTGSWTGPHIFSSAFDASVTCPYELADGTESLLVGGYDGLIRDGNVESVGAVDDVIVAGTGGTNITLSTTLPDLLMGDPSTFKNFNATQSIQADLKTNGSLSIITNSESQAQATTVVASAGTGMKPYGFRPLLKGYRPTLNIQDATAEIIRINGLSLEADMGRGQL
ncbi:MAG: hypothetical protein KAJ55_00365 [Anaerolineales bacterium]|nr:hypothetical protein [Anaerolineales bacterium]